MAGLKDKKLQASTLVEVLIAMVIIMAVFVVAMAIYTRVTGSGYALSSTRSQLQMQQIIRESISSRDWQEQQVEVDSIVYQKTVTAYPGYDDLVVIEVKATQNDQVLGKLRQVVRKEENNE